MHHLYGYGEEGVVRSEIIGKGGRILMKYSLEFPNLIFLVTDFLPLVDWNTCCRIFLRLNESDIVDGTDNTRRE